MKTITKKMLSVLMAVLVLLGGVWVSFAIEPAADAIEYDTTYDYSTVSPDNYGAWNYTDLGAEDINRQGTNENSFFVCRENNTAPGLNVSYGGLNVEWGANGEAYLVYKVAGGTKFEATFFMKDVDSRNRWGDTIGEPFEFKIESSASKDSGWANAVTTKDEVGTASSTEGKYDIVLTYDVPENCEYVKITFPQKGLLTGTTARLNDMAYLTKVRFFKVKPINYDTAYVYDKSTLSQYTLLSTSDLNAYAMGGVELYRETDAGINPGYGIINSDWGTIEQAYVIYRVAAGTNFEATLKIGSNQNRQNIENATGEPFEFVIEASANGTDGWQTIGTTDGNDGTPDPSNDAYADIVLTCDVPDNCSFVKITFPQKGKIVYSWATVAGNDMARLCGVRFFKYVAPVASFDTAYDYSEGTKNTEINDSNKANYGIYALNPTNAHKLYSNAEIGGDAASYSGGIGGGWVDLGTTWGSKNAPYVIYNVEAGSTFEVTFRMLPQTKRNQHATAAGEALEAVIVASDSATGGWKNEVTTADKDVVNAGPYEDVTITYTVPDDCTFVKITLPLKGTIPNSTYRGNDMARIMGVKYFSYVDPVTNYDTIHDYSDATANTVEVTAGNMANYGIVALNPNNAVGLVAPTKANNPQDGGIGGNYSQLGGAWGSKNRPYVIYRVSKGTKFEATFRTMPKATRERYAGLTNESMEITIESSNSLTDGWKNLVDTTGLDGVKAGSYEDIIITYDVPADCQYVKITLPLSGIITGTYRGNDYARIMGVKYFKYVAPTPTYDTTHDYSDISVEAKPVNGSSIGSFGIYSYNSSVKAPALYINEAIGNDWRGGIGPGYGSLGAAWGELEKNFVIYEVKPGTFFELTARMIGDSSKSNFASKTGEPFEFTVEASTNDLGGWKNKVDTSSATSVAAGPYKDYTITYEVPADCSFVKVTFPQKGVIPGTSSRANDAARIMKVRLNAAKNFYEGTDTVVNYKANGAVNFFYDNDAALLYLYKMNGTVIENFSNGAAYVAPSVSYLNSGTGIEKPYVIFAIEGGTKFVAGINVNREAAAALGADFAMKLYESADGANWTLVSAQVESLGDIDYHTFNAAANTKYVKIEYPHTEAVKSVDKVNEVYGLIAVGFNPLESAYEITNPYGNYTFKNVDKFHGDALAAQYDVQKYGIYEDIGGVFVFEAAVGKPYYYLAYGYGNLVNNAGSDYCGLTYSVKPGTAFQAVALTSRNNGDCQIVERTTGKPFDIIVQISSNGKTWTDYTPSRILTDKHLMDLTDLNAGSRFVTEVITIPVLPADAKFVKLLYPQTASIKVMTGGADNRAGNDFIGLTQVSFTKGDAVPPYLYEPDNSKYEEIFDFTESTYDISALNPTGVVYDAGLGSLSPGWGYFYQTGKAIREKCAVTVSVKEGSAFFVDFGYRPERFALMEGEDYRVKLYFSSDCNNWTHVTDKYVEVAPGTGALTLVHRFEIDKLPAGVKYVKVEFPHDHDMRGDVTAAGKVHGLLGNDNCGLKKIFFTGDDHHDYKHIIQHGYFFEEFEDFPEDIDEKNAKVLGLYDYTKNAFKLGDYTNSEANDGRITIKETYLFNKTEVDPIYVTYNVVPGTEFFMMVPTSATASRLTIMPTARMKIYASETGKDGSWTEIKNYFFTDRENNAQTTYYINNVGAKTNFIKVVFPNTGDLVAQGLAEGASGATFFMIKEIRATLVDYDPTWEGKTEEHNFKKPTLNNKVDSGNTVVVNPFNWLFVIIPAAAVLLLGAAALVIILIIKKKKKAANQ